MPFCRKCGRRLPEYSQVCTDCGQSTTAPIINLKRAQGSPSLAEGRDAKIAKAILPKVAPLKVQVITAKPAKTVAPVKIVSPVKDVAQLKAVAPVKIAPAKPAEPPKPVISAKHIVKPKKVKPSKPTAPFTIVNARPVAGLDIAEPKLVAPPKPRMQPKPVVSTAPTVPPKAVAQPEPVVAPVVPVAPSPPKTMAVRPKSVHSPKPITPAPVYPPHEIIKSNISLKKDILTNPQDYETQSFDFDLECRRGHFWPAGKVLPVSNGRAYCLQCGERLRKPRPKRNKRRRPGRFGSN